MNLREKIFCCAMTLVPMVITTAWPVSLVTSGEYLFDNTVYFRKGISLAAREITLPCGMLEAGASYGRSEFSRGINGIREFDDAFMSCMAGYSYQGRVFSTGADVSAGNWRKDGDERSFISGSLPFEWRLPWQGFRLMTEVALRRGTADDNPVVTRIGVGKRTVKADAGFGIKGWELHAAYQREEYSGVRRADYQPILSDTAFFQAFYDILNPFLGFINTQTDPFPENEIRQVSVYGFGPVGPMFYAGGSYVYRNAREDLYLPIADDEDGTIINAFFPYITPSEERVFSLIAAFAGHWRTAGVFLNDFTFKLEFPFYSSGSYHGYYQANPQNLLAGLQDFVYDYNGLGTLTQETEIGKDITGKWGVSLRHIWVSRPYIAYRYFGKDAYQYHTINIAIKKEL